MSERVREVPDSLRLWGARQFHFSLGAYSRFVIGRCLRRYQQIPGEAILRSVLDGQGTTFAVMMARQAGKNELSAHLEAYLLGRYSHRAETLVKASPTYKPQTLNSMLRLLDRLDNQWSRGKVQRREGYIVEVDRARAYFFSAEPTANVVGATASLLLEADEAQDIAQTKWDKDFVPMGASFNATTVLYGTAWTSATFLARTIAYLEQEQARDGVQRVFRVTADEVAAEVPAYGDFVRSQVLRLGRHHPLVRTQYYLEAIDGSGGLFPQRRRALMRGGHARRHAPEPGHRYAVLIDVGGEDETEGDGLERAMLANPRRDATAVTVVDVVRVPDAAGRAIADRRYLVVDRALHLGTRHTALYDRILALVRLWAAPWVVVDATGVGAGLASFLSRALGERVIPVEFSANVKSDLGWDFVALVETGRFQDYADDQAADTRQFWYEVERCQYEIQPGPAKRMRWGVWETPAYDGLIARGHDDLLISAALCTVVDKRDAPGGDGSSGIVALPDVLDEVDRASW